MEVKEEEERSDSQEKYIQPMRDFILRDDNKGLGVMELKLKFEREINDPDLIAKNIGYWSYYNKE
jgi:hypothetical protein